MEESLTCPTCDKLFIAKSILERHLKKSQHGMFEKVSSERMNREKSDICLQTYANISHMKLGYPEIVIFGRDTNCGIIYGRKSLTANLIDLNK